MTYSHLDLLLFLCPTRFILARKSVWGFIITDIAYTIIGWDISSYVILIISLILCNENCKICIMWREMEVIACYETFLKSLLITLIFPLGCTVKHSQYLYPLPGFVALSRNSKTCSVQSSFIIQKTHDLYNYTYYLKAPLVGFYLKSFVQSMLSAFTCTYMNQANIQKQMLLQHLFLCSRDWYPFDCANGTQFSILHD